jgi:hypothetical protein
MCGGFGEVLGSNINRDTGCSDSKFSWYSSIPVANCWKKFLTSVMPSFLETLSNSPAPPFHATRSEILTTFQINCKKYESIPLTERLTVGFADQEIRRDL